MSFRDSCTARLASAVLAVSFASGSLLPLGASAATQSTPSTDAVIAALRAHVKHVFVVYQENRSFDSYFGTFPGADNLASPDAQSNGYRQYDPLGQQWVTPFRITDADLSDADHSRNALITKSDNGAMDLFVSTEEFGLLGRGYSREDAQRVGLLTMAHEDCDTIPFLWKYAKTFSLYDHFFQGMFGPSTPGNIELIAAQTGQTQLARHATEQIAASNSGPGLPVVNDAPPAFGPYPNGPPDPLQMQDDLTFATTMLTLSGKEAVQAKTDADDISDDVAQIAKLGKSPIPFGWYQEGFGKNGQANFSYVTHHNAMQYFGYLRENKYFWSGVHDLTEVFPAIEDGKLGDRSVVYVKGGYFNPFKWKPGNHDPQVQSNFNGDDDHPGYSDSQLSESLVAKVVNAVAHSKYWKDSAIFVIWDDSEGYYDHASPPKFERCPDGRPCGDGPRVPALLISPYAKSNGIIADMADHASFTKFLDVLYGLPPLASLPDEAPYLPLGPRDMLSSISNLVDGFDPNRLLGKTAPIDSSAAIIDDSIVNSFPAKMSCATLGITPAKLPGENTVPKGFAPRTSEH